MLRLIFTIVDKLTLVKATVRLHVLILVIQKRSRSAIRKLAKESGNDSKDNNSEMLLLMLSNNIVNNYKNGGINNGSVNINANKYLIQ